MSQRNQDCEYSEGRRDGRVRCGSTTGFFGTAMMTFRAGADVNSIDPSLPSQNLRQHTTTLSSTAERARQPPIQLNHPHRFGKDGASKHARTTGNSLAATCPNCRRHEQLAMGSVEQLGFREQGCRVHDCGYNTGCRCWWGCLLLLQ